MYNDYYIPNKNKAYYFNLQSNNISNYVCEVR